MTRIRATCPSCGEVELRPGDVVLRRVTDEIGEVSSGSCYRFSCPDCTELVEKPADERIVSLLATGGVPVEDVGPDTDLDDRPRHPEAAVGGPPLSHDDLLDLHFALEDPRWFDRLLATTGR
ncbi:MAG: hypothetical protein WEB03_15680 [Nitriliruptor sp.]|uniref:hypothetical protein n=1 Tax=Nitriliruptor sp. TaxID=2448056 RepID=UPI0034A037EB